jgi:uncharacterized protein (TIGR03437 family)
MRSENPLAAGCRLSALGLALCTLAAAAQPPAVTSVTSGAGNQSSIASGSWVTIIGTNLANNTRTWRADEIVNGQLPTSLDGTSVTINGKPAFVYYISPVQLDVQAPSDATAGSVPVVVTNNGLSSNPVSADLEQFSPALFLWQPGNYAVASHANFALAVKNGEFPGWATAPANPQEVIILWGTGFGPTNPAVSAGQVVGAGQQAALASTPTITIGGGVADYLSGVLAPGSAGLYQLAVRLPPNLPNGDLPVVVEIGGVTAPGGLLTINNPNPPACPIAGATPASKQTRVRLGAYVFDGWGGTPTSFNLSQLMDGSYQSHQPLSGWRDDNACAIEQQLAWAHSFGLDFFLFDWYFKAEFFSPGQNLNSAIEFTHTLPDRHGMQYAILYVDEDPFTVSPADWHSAIREWIAFMKDPAYLLVNGKPYLGVIDMRLMRQAFGSSAAVNVALNQVRAAGKAAGFPGVFIVGGFGTFDGSSGIDGLFPDLSMAKADGYDAATIYASGFDLPLAANGEQPFSEMADVSHWIWSQGAAKSPVAFIPVVTDGLDPRPNFQYAGWETGRPEFWVTRTPQDVASLTNDAITWAESNPQVRAEPTPAAPIVLIGAWNELAGGAYIVPTAGDGTSYGDALGAMLATPPSQLRSVLTLHDSGASSANRSAGGTLTAANRAPIARATITLSGTPAGGAYTQYQLSGQPPAGAPSAIIGFRINTDDPTLLWPGYFFAGPGASNFAVYQVSYMEPAGGGERVPNGSFTSGAQSWTLAGQTQIVPSDRTFGQMVQVVATPSQLAMLDSAPFPITPGAAFQVTISARVAPESLGSGYFFLAFEDRPGDFLHIPGPSAGALFIESIPLAPGKAALGTATTDLAGNFQLSLSSLGTSPAILEATYTGDTRRWPAYARVGP